ncbi:anti-sigma factor [Marinimicrobium sp. C6131]|uniref:anti-sigma factor n=1 Tax=Marinimicrobium sp. C6131 TaxID=3022676 RepID=UPI00223CAA29|nr:anti-sigma factor [Marinimicrobium sp. C6131]UZJ43386.1 anti-sigma factor [Marinimicrobium sp. C6131]
MSGSTDRTIKPDRRAFEYALGTLRGSERRAFERAMAQDPALAREVHDWEEHLMALQDPHAGRPPAPDTWERIEQRLAGSRQRPRRRYFSWSNWGWGGAVAALVLVLALPMVLIWKTGAPLWPTGAPQAPNSDYVAVLADTEGQPRLTALTLQGGETLWLQWDEYPQTEGSLQLWAVSRRDGQARSLAIFDNAERRTLALDQAARRLITDAEYLLLTEEPPGGSPLDEPSDRILARGACVRLSTS